MSNVSVRFGYRLRSLRRDRKLTQVQLADYLGIDRSFISDVERGKKSMTLGYLATVADGFHLTVTQLLDGS